MHGLQNWRMTIIAGTPSYCINSKYIYTGILYNSIYAMVGVYSLTGAVSSSSDCNDSATNYSLVHDAMSKRVQVAGMSFLNIWCTIIWR